jgi:16S rRNA (uracil1498-N3)-methyltransferase
LHRCWIITNAPLCYHRDVLRRVHTPRLHVGSITLDSGGSKHARDVLRLNEGDEVEIFDDAGNVADAVITALSPRVVVRVDSVTSAPSNVFDLTIAAAIPKGERADWMIEKLSELGVARFIPLATERSVVLPEGRNKRDRWVRIATESAKQSRRAGVMQIDELTQLKEVVARAPRPCSYLSPEASAGIASVQPLTLLIGPEGGWTDAEIQLFAQSQIQPLKLTQTILRIETAAIAAAAVVLTSNSMAHP